MSPSVVVEGDRDVALITINRPERRNALDSATATALRDAIEASGKTARVIILTGAGDAFCAGGDLDELEEWSKREPDEIRESLYGSFQGTVRAIRAADAVVIAAIEGAAVGAGLDIALACDLRVASEGARLAQVWVRLGVIPGTGGAWLTQALVGPGRAAELLLTGDAVAGREALTLGLVNAVVPAGSLLEDARAMAGRILRHPREGVIANKRALVATTDAAVEAALAYAAEVQPHRFVSEEFRSALRTARRRAEGS